MHNELFEIGRMCQPWIICTHAGFSAACLDMHMTCCQSIKSAQKAMASLAMLAQHDGGYSFNCSITWITN